VGFSFWRLELKKKIGLCRFGLEGELAGIMKVGREACATLDSHRHTLASPLSTMVPSITAAQRPPR
jgi:hypothetical protein